MSLIDQTYFIGGLTIPNLGGVGIVPAANVEKLNWFIATYEPQYLCLVLGETLYNAFVAGLKVVPNEARWQDLKSKFVDDQSHISPIAGFVYYHHMRDRLSSTTAQGEVQQAQENAQVVINTDKMSLAYKKSMRTGTIIRSFLKDNVAYPEYKPEELEELSLVNNFGI